jgi:hypothetical protein
LGEDGIFRDIFEKKPNLYMAEEVKRKNYPLRIGSRFSYFRSSLTNTRLKQQGRRFGFCFLL